MAAFHLLLNRTYLEDIISTHYTFMDTKDIKKTKKRTYQVVEGNPRYSRKIITKKKSKYIVKAADVRNNIYY